MVHPMFGKKKTWPSTKWRLLEDEDYTRYETAHNLVVWKTTRFTTMGDAIRDRLVGLLLCCICHILGRGRTRFCFHLPGDGPVVIVLLCSRSLRTLDSSWGLRHVLSTSSEVHHSLVIVTLVTSNDWTVTREGGCWLRVPGLVLRTVLHDLAWPSAPSFFWLNVCRSWSSSTPLTASSVWGRFGTSPCCGPARRYC